MAIAAGCIWNLQTDGTTTHGAGFVTGATGTDYSKTIAASLPANNTVTGASSPGAGNVVNTAQASADWVGNTTTPTAGTNFTLTAGMRYECLSVVVGVSATFSTNVSGGSICTGIGSGGAFIIGGAGKFYGSGTDDVLFENSVAGHIWMIKTGSHSSGALSLTAAGTVTLPLEIRGFTSVHSDYLTTTGSNKPSITISNILIVANTWMTSLTWRGVGTTTTTSNGANNRFINCKFMNTSTTANGVALNILQHGIVVRGCELISIRGYGLQMSTIVDLVGNWFHSSSIGCRSAGTNSSTIYGNVFSGNTLSALTFSGSSGSSGNVINNTFYGFETPTGIGYEGLTGTISGRLLNNTFYGFATGLSHADANQRSTNEEYSNIFNCTTARSNVDVGAGSVALDPVFTNVVQRSGATATIVATNQLTQAGATFQTWGITAGTHYLLYVSGSGAAVTGIYQISSVDSETQLTTVEAFVANATADHVWRIVTGFDWSQGVNAQAVAFPSTVSGTSTTSYGDIGAIQSDKSAQYTDVLGANVLTTVGAYKYNSKTNNRTPTYSAPVNTNVKTGVAFGVADTGSYDGTDRHTHPTEAQVELGVQWKNNSTTNNKTGTLVAGGGTGTILRRR